MRNCKLASELKFIECDLFFFNKNPLLLRFIEVKCL